MLFLIPILILPEDHTNCLSYLKDEAQKEELLKQFEVLAQQVDQTEPGSPEEEELFNQMKSPKLTTRIAARAMIPHHPISIIHSAIKYSSQ